MSKTRRRPSRKTAASSEPAPKESLTSAVEAVTVAWMLSLTATVAAQILTGAVHVLVLIGGPNPPFPLNMLPGTLLLVSLVTGTFCLLLTPLAWRMRKVRPPGLLLLLAIVCGLLPWILLVGMMVVSAV